MLRRAPKPPSLSALYTLSTHATHEAVHLLCQMLVFDPVRLPAPHVKASQANSFSLPFQDKRISVIDALAHPYVDEGRLRYHSCMCKCCYTPSAGMRQYAAEFEPSAPQPFDDLWERKLTSVQQVKGTRQNLKKIVTQLLISRFKLITPFFIRFFFRFVSFRPNRGNAQIHSRTTANESRATVYKSSERRI